MCIWAAYQASFYHETIGNDRDDDKAGEDEDETISNTIDEKNAEFMNNESLSDTRLDE